MGDFKDDPRALVERYYDAFLYTYTANWGTRQVLLRLPVTLLDLETAEQYCTTDAASSWSSGEHVILDLTYGADDGGEWDDDYDDVEPPSRRAWQGSWPPDRRPTPGRRRLNRPGHGNRPTPCPPESTKSGEVC